MSFEWGQRSVNTNIDLIQRGKLLVDSTFDTNMWWNRILSHHHENLNQRIGTSGLNTISTNFSTDIKGILPLQHDQNSPLPHQRAKDYLSVGPKARS